MMGNLRNLPLRVVKNYLEQEKDAESKRIGPDLRGLSPKKDADSVL